MATTNDIEEQTGEKNIPDGNEAISEICSVRTILKICPVRQVVDFFRKSQIGFLCLNLVLVIIVSVLTFIVMMYITERRNIGQMGGNGQPGSQSQQGPMEEQCQKGEKGDQGQRGQMGSTGLQGNQGQKGEKGDKGDATSKTCDYGWSSFGRYCYFFGKENKTWTDAETDCKNKFGHLVKIGYAEENDYLKSEAKVKRIGSAWIGGNDLDKEGQLRWVSDDSRVDLGFSDWVPGEPNNDGEEDCLQLWSERSYKWNDYKCARKSGYICKK